MRQTIPATAQIMNAVCGQCITSNSGPGEAKIPVPMSVPMIYEIRIRKHAHGYTPAISNVNSLKGRLRSSAIVFFFVLFGIRDG